MKKIAVLLTGCGHRDGSEITEVVSTLISLSEFGAHYQCFAPDLTIQSINHLTGQPDGNQRNAIAEAARIARGKVKPLTELNPSDFDGLAIPGGYGAALHFSDFASRGEEAKPLPIIKKIIEEFHKSSKPIAMICIAPYLAALVLGAHHPTVTLGEPGAAVTRVEKLGAHHEVCAAKDYVTDRENKIISSPAYMYDDSSPFDVYSGIRKAVRELVEMA